MENTSHPQGPEAVAQWTGARGGYPVNIDSRLAAPGPFAYNHPFPVYWTINPEVPLEQFSMPMGPGGLYTQPYNGFMGHHPMSQAMPFTPVPVFSPQALGKRSHGTSAPRRTLTNDDRRRMCQYHIDHPRVKQAEIGKMFGVERSTVSKVLQKKDYFLSLGEESVSPVRKPGRRNPDVEKTLANYIRKNAHQNLPDRVVFETAKNFARSTSDPEIQRKMSDPKWVSEFRRQILDESGVERSVSVESGPSSVASSDVSTPRTAPEVPLGRDVKREKLGLLTPLTDIGSFAPNDDTVNTMPACDTVYPTMELPPMCPIDPLLLKFEEESARDRTPSLTATSTTSSLYDQPIDDSLDFRFVSPKALFKSSPTDSQWHSQDFAFSEPAAKKHCTPKQMVSIESEIDCNLFESNLVKTEFDEMTASSVAPLFVQMQPGFQTNNPKRRRE
ncbi:hypothetical protein KEM56_006951 [Ascosphaera pollenicola]|nr:hypothetical protein KEM56_006951 [Ascosphaera pollenicola]